MRSSSIRTWIIIAITWLCTPHVLNDWLISVSSWILFYRCKIFLSDLDICVYFVLLFALLMKLIWRPKHFAFSRMLSNLISLIILSFCLICSSYLMISSKLLSALIFSHSPSILWSHMLCVLWSLAARAFNWLIFPLVIGLSSGRIFALCWFCTL